jgi:hypothetical protein
LIGSTINHRRMAETGLPLIDRAASFCMMTGGRSTQRQRKTREQTCPDQLARTAGSWPRPASMPQCASSNSSQPTSATRTPGGLITGRPRNSWPGARAPSVGARLKCHPARKVQMTPPLEADPTNKTRRPALCSFAIERVAGSSFFVRSRRRFSVPTWLCGGVARSRGQDWSERREGHRRRRARSGLDGGEHDVSVGQVGKGGLRPERPRPHRVVPGPSTADPTP